jgi:hypothetical protein
MKIKTPSDELNKVLGGGIPVDRITMFYGDPGVGKTKMMLDFAYYVAGMGHSISMSTSGDEQVKKFFNSHRGKKVLASMARNNGTPDVFFVDDYRMAPWQDSRQGTLLALQERGITVVAFGPMPRMMFSYSCAVIVRIMNQRGIVDLHVEKNRHGTTGSFVRYRHPDDVPEVKVMIEMKDIDPNKVKHRLKDNWSFDSDVDRSGETYNPYTGKWSFL